MEIGPRTQVFLDKCAELKGIESEAQAAYRRATDASNANADAINAFEARMLNEPVTEELLTEWRNARKRMAALDAERSDRYTRFRDVRGKLSDLMNGCFVTFRLEHIDVGNPENQAWPEP